MKRLLIGVAGLALLAGCRAASVAPTEQPVVFKTAAYDAVWQAAHDVLAEHFPVYTSRKAAGDVVTQFDSTHGLFEFWRDRTTNSRDLWEDTVQTIRRRARAAVAKSPDGVSLTLVVEKERRDRASQANASFSFGKAANPFDPYVNALDQAALDPTAPDWMPLGRDPAYEAYLLAEIHKRLGE